MRPRHSHNLQLCAGFSGLSLWSCAQHCGNLNSDRRSESGAWIPSLTCGIGSVIAGGDVIEVSSAAGILIEQGIDKADRLAHALVNECDESSPEWSHGARASDYVGLAIDISDVASGWIGVSGNVGNAATNILV